MSESKQRKKNGKRLIEDKQLLINLYKAQWNSIHDMNNLDWRVALIFIPLIGAVSFIFGIALELDLKEPNIYTTGIKILSLISYSISVYGLWTVAKGHVQTMVQFKNLERIEMKLNFTPFIAHRRECCHRFWPTIASRRIMLFIVYWALGFLSFSMIITPMNEWNFNACVIFSNPMILVPLVLPIFLIAVQWHDHQIHCYQQLERGNNYE